MLIGAVVGALVGFPGGIDLLLALARQCPLPTYPTPRVLGVDDWAMRKGQRYGIILVDHESGHIVDLLPDRTAERLAQWLRDHPGVEIVTRDRAEAYAQAISDGAPDAVQVADRWHLLKNLTDPLTMVLQDHRTAIRQHLDSAASPGVGGPDAGVPAQSSASSDTAATGASTSEAAPTPADKQRQPRGEDAHRLHAQGWT